MILIKDINEGNLVGNELKKYRQKKKILQILYKYDSLSGSTLSKRIGVSLPTSLSILNELIGLDLVEVRGTGASKGGRNPTMFGLSNNSIFVVACELGRYKGKIILYNVHNQPVTPIVYFDTSIDDVNLVDKIYSNALKLIKKNRIDKGLILGVGLTMPGLVDEAKGINYTIKKEEYRNVKERLEAKFQKLVYINNDARMQAFGEFKFGKAKGHNNAIIVNWNWGIGLGMIMDGKLYNGATGFAGELSHIKFIDNGDLCICGKRGCLETVASVNVILKNAREGITKGRVSQLTEKFKNKIKDLKADDILLAAKSGDEFSISLLNKVGLALGEGLSVTIQLLNPDIIVLGGIMAQAKQFVLTPIQQSINKYCLEQISANTKIVISEDWEQSGLLGITAVLFQKLFSDMHK